MEIKFINICYPINICYNRIVSSQEFLSWAKSDLKGDGRRGMGNALSNIKKSIHSRIDEILNLSHIICSKDWDSRVSTDKKVGILKKLDIEHTSIIRIITKIRNVYEHQYTLPSDLTDIKAYYETTELWLNHSTKSLIKSRLALINLPVYSVQCDSDRFIKVIEFPLYVDKVNIIYFRENKKIVSKLTKDEREGYEKMKDVEIATFIQWEKKHLKTSHQTEPYYLTPRNLTKVFNIYKKSLYKVNLGFYLGNPRIELT